MHCLAFTTGTGSFRGVETGNDPPLNAPMPTQRTTQMLCCNYMSIILLKAQQIKQVTVLFNSLTPVNFLRNLSAFIRSYIINKN